jgi:hypothetical protein
VESLNYSIKTSYDQASKAVISQVHSYANESLKDKQWKAEA